MDCIAELAEDTCSGIDCNEEEDDSYIEIALDTAPACCNDEEEEEKSNLKGKGSCNDMDEGDQYCEDEYRLRISISSTIPLPFPLDLQSTEKTTTEPTVAATGAPRLSSSVLMMSCSANTTRACSESRATKPLQQHKHSGVSQNHEPWGVQFPAADNRLCNSVPFNSTVLWESRQPDIGQTTMQSVNVIPYNLDVLAPRKQPSMGTSTTRSGGMMKLLIKFRGIKIGAILASLVKPRQPCQANNNGHKSSKKSKTLFQCYQKRLVNPSNGRCNVKRDQGRRSKHWDLDDDSITARDPSRSSSKKSSRVLEMDLGALRGAFSAVGMSIAQKGSRSKRTTWSKSCGNSPIHEGFSLCSSDQNSIQAAIAYCKSSSGQTSDFSF